MLEKRRSIANQVLSSVTYYPNWLTSRKIIGPLETESALGQNTRSCSMASGWRLPGSKGVGCPYGYKRP
ncbi:hypothetical protein DFAR_3240011 [Desulfarculales bacterium]